MRLLECRRAAMMAVKAKAGVVDHVTDDARQSLPLTVAATTTRRNAAASSAAEGDERKAPVVGVRSSSTVERTAGHE